MWTVIYMANSLKTAEKVKKIMIKEGFLVRLRIIDKYVDKNGCYEVMVPYSEAIDAQNILIRNGL
ncbi:hypothetical protein ACETAC_04660 [Aceticella autotrophica]|uniref:Glutamate decarboxylase n=1 Tax=Aceticella autotrophica TaxID=2755338 RepID=A0A975AXE1_9THEO|nr:hypothetical protein [Aceticella autotrophica]QSZ28146.1 hypothetical protein ACETAC_04660 [Aceticella autotrophica]